MLVSGLPSVPQAVSRSLAKTVPARLPSFAHLHTQSGSLALRKSPAQLYGVLNRIRTLVALPRASFSSGFYLFSRSGARPLSSLPASPQSVETTVARGTAFENASKEVLYELFGMDLQRVGGAGDAGVDLQGWWYLPDSATGPPEPAARATPAKQEVMYAEHVKDMNHPWNGFYDSPEHFAQTVRGRVSTIMQCFPKPFHGTYSEAVEASRSPMTTTKMGCATYGAGEDERNEIYELYRGVWQLRWLDQISGDTAARHEEGTREQDLHSPDALPHRLRVVAQCKAESKPLGPVKLRELEGTLGRITQNAKTSGAHSASSEAAPVGVLISLEGFSKQTINQTMSSSFPILLLHLQRGMACSTSSSPTDSRSPSPNLGARGIAQANSSSRASVEELRNASMSSIMMNQALSGSKGPLGGRLDVRWTHRLQSNYSPSSVRGKLASPPLPTGSTRRPALFWDGKLLGKRGRERQVER